MPEDVKLIRTVELGTPLVVEALWERLKLGPALRKAMKDSGGSALHERALLAMTANRLCDPDSKLGVWDRWLHSVYLPSCNTVKLYQMYEAMDLLHENVAEVENAVFFHVANLFNLVVDVIFYDTATASFSITDLSFPILPQRHTPRNPILQTIAKTRSTSCGASPAASYLI